MCYILYDLQMAGSSQEYRVELEASTEDTGTMLRGPHEDLGFIPNCRDSFEGCLRLRVWRRPPPAAALLPGVPSEPQLLVDAHSTLAAVEVGGGPWEGTWQAKCTLPELALAAVTRPLDVGKIVGDMLSG
jgi:tocopherol cyclase